MKEIKKIKKVVLMLLLVICTFCVAMPIQSTPAKTWTKAAINKEIKKTKKQIKKYEALNKKNKKGVVPISGSIVSRDPLILEDYFMGSTTYYWVENSKKMNTFLTFSSGYVKKTGKYKKYNNYTCAVVKAVKVTTYDNKIDKLEKKLSTYQKALKQFVYVSAPDMPQCLYLQPGQSYAANVTWEYSDCIKYCKCSFSSSDKSVATVSAKGVVKAVGNGTAKITVKVSPSGKKSEFKVVCGEEPPVQLDKSEYTCTNSEVIVNYNARDGWEIDDWDDNFEYYYDIDAEYDVPNSIRIVMLRDAPESFTINIEFTDGYTTVKIPFMVKNISTDNDNSDGRLDQTENNGNYNDDYYDDDGEW